MEVLKPYLMKSLEKIGKNEIVHTRYTRTTTITKTRNGLSVLFKKVT